MNTFGIATVTTLTLAALFTLLVVVGSVVYGDVPFHLVGVGVALVALGAAITALRAVQKARSRHGQ